MIDNFHKLKNLSYELQFSQTVIVKYRSQLTENFGFANKTENA
jgi:hypothetical protein